MLYIYYYYDYGQFRTYGSELDTNPKSVWDKDLDTMPKIFAIITICFQPYDNISLKYREMKELRNARSLSYPYPK
jgi:hypothetical protein